jgi:hypothetical protein
MANLKKGLADDLTAGLNQLKLLVANKSLILTNMIYLMKFIFSFYGQIFVKASPQAPDVL